MAVYALWHGGASYAVPYVESREEFPNLAAALEAFVSRTEGDPYYPAVTREPAEVGGPSMLLYFADPAETSDPYPDRLIEYGADEGIIISDC